MLSKVKQFWIDGVLKKSLHNQVLIELSLEERSDYVPSPLEGVEEFSSDSRQVFAPGTTAADIFEDIGAGRTLLILGEPGSGKTVTLLKLAETLINRTENALSQPLPVVLNLSSWVKQRKSISDWLVQELYETYQVSKSLGKAWIDDEQLILLLDGLDEVSAKYRDTCVQELNIFIQSHGRTELTLCSRIQDYETLSEKVKLRSAIYVQPLTSKQICQYLDKAGSQLWCLKRLLQNNTDLLSFASSPLMLSIMSLAYHDCSLDAIPKLSTAEAWRKRLFDNYIERMFHRRGDTQKYSKHRTQQWLIHLAQNMTAATQTVFVVERIQPNWLKKRSERILYIINTVLISGIIGKAAVMLITTLLQLVLSNIIYKYFLSAESLTFVDPSSLLRYLTYTGTIEGVIMGLVVGLTWKEIKTLETLSWSFKEAKSSLPKVLSGISWLIPGLIGGYIGWHIGPILGLFLGSIVLLTVGLTRWDHKKVETPNWSWELLRLDLASAIPGLIGVAISWWVSRPAKFSLGVLSGGVPGLLLGFINSGVSYTELAFKAYPNQGIWHSSRNSLFVATVTFAFLLISFELLYAVIFRFSGAYQSQSFLFFFFVNLPIALYPCMIAALIVGLANGGISCLKHLVLRLMISLMGYAPWHYARFLDYAAERLFLQKVGGGYIFIHRMLLEHFAAMKLDQTNSRTR
ncbi:MAG: NACHT domain-containing protein [Cyanobacteria bacterium P01_D01_bin.156]